MTEFQELIQDAPNFVSMERGELVTYAYGMFAAGTKANAENVKLRQLVAAYASALMRMCDQTQALYPCDKCVLGKGHSSDRCGIDELKEETHKLRVEADALD